MDDMIALISGDVTATLLNLLVPWRKERIQMWCVVMCGVEVEEGKKSCSVNDGRREKVP